MKNSHIHSNPPAGQFLEVLEQRIAPAAVVAAPAATGALNESGFTAAPVGSSILLTAGHGISTADSGGSYLLYVQAGQAMVFTTDLNGNNKVDFNEITGIAAGAGLRLLSFVDINGDVVTNLRSDGHLTDSDGDASNGYDGKIVLNSHIESITLRSVTESDLNAALFNNQNTPHNRVARSDYSINGNIYAGGGIGSDTNPGLTIDTSGFATQKGQFTENFNYGSHDTNPTPNIGYIYTGTAVSGKMFSFGTSTVYGNLPTESIRGKLVDFVPPSGQAGGDIVGVKSVGTDPLNPPKYYIGGLVAGNGGFGAHGGDIRNVAVNGDIGTFEIIAGNGGKGSTGGNGGSVTNFSALACETTLVAIKTGDGGFGLLGAGGAAGTISFATATDGTPQAAQFYGDVHVGLGKGGDAFGNASDGTSVAAGKFTLPDIGGIVTPAATVSTTRVAGDFDRPTSFDLNGDGYSDVVYITDNPSQLKVLLGNGTGGFLEARILDGSSYAPIGARFSPVAVADFNGDGLMDIVTASSAGDSFTGIKVFINKGNDPLHPTDPAYWLGFDDARFSPIPYHYDTMASAATNLVTGDFDHNGVTDIGIVSNYYFPGSGIPYGTRLTVLSGLSGADGTPDGFFAADFKKGAGTTPLSHPSVELGGPEPGTLLKYSAESSVIVKATATTLGDKTTDAIAVMGRAGAFIPDTYDNGALSVYTVTPNFTGGQSIDNLNSPWQGADYTPRKLSGNPAAWTGYDMSKDAAISARDFAIADANGDGIFDPVVLGDSSQGAAAVFFQGSATGALNPVLNTDTTAPHAGSYYGILLCSGEAKYQPLLSTKDWTIYTALSFNSTTTALPSDVYGFTYTVGVGSGIQKLTTNPLGANQGFGQTDAVLASDLGQIPSFSTAGAGLTQSVLYDAFYPLKTTNGVSTGDAQFQGMQYFKVPKLWELNTAITTAVVPATVPPTYTTADQYFILAPNKLLLTAGDGGFSFLGAGGRGGSIGNGTPVTLDANGAATTSVIAKGYDSGSLTTGKGGNGFTAGGNAGSFSGVAAVFYSNPDTYETTRLNTGVGGSSMRGIGGNGGSFSQISMRGLTVSNTEIGPGMALSAGDGGFGLTGGAGGGVFGRGNATLGLEDSGGFDSYAVAAGNGGFGINAGGSGGSVTSFLNLLKVETNFGVYGNAILASYVGGHGGYSVAGIGGSGGSVLNCSPSANQNFLTGDLKLVSGDGGSGVTGGAGGDISNFINTETTQYYAKLIFAVAGQGGDGVNAGGRGGSLSNVTATSSATVGTSPYEYSSVSKFVAGNGGVGAAGTGGAGGSLTNVNSTSTAGSIVGIAGDGGDGLKSGGVGGGVSGSQLNSSALNDGRVVVFAGNGGDAHGVTQKEIASEKTALPIYQGIIAMGAVNGTGGNGGSITGFTQPATTQTSTDLTAGNGGSTVNWGLYTFGRPGQPTAGIGAGGSITNTNLTGDAGKISDSVAIKSYAPDFTANIRDESAITSITDATGNVGVVVGNQGFVRNGDSCAAGKAGSVSTFTARNIMSMVAGSVDRLAAITSISGLSLQQGGLTLGAYKSVDALGNPVPHVGANNLAYYSDADYTGSVIASAQVGGSLVDGAILAKSWTGAKPQSPRVFIG